MRSGFVNVGLLTSCNAMAFAATPLMMFVGSLVGAKLAPSTDLATLPIAMMVVGTAVGIVPATRLMQKLGRKNALYIFLAIGTCAGGVAAASLAGNSFVGFCLAASMVGAANAAVQQLRFAAMESVSADNGPTAASLVMCGGIIAAFLGPEMALWGKDIADTEYLASFGMVSLCFVASAVILSFYQPTQTLTNQQNQATRPISQMLKSPGFCLAIGSATVSYVIMTFVMTGTPISMHHHHGHSLLDTKWVIQSHIAAMFLPSLITPILFRLVSIKTLMVMGLACYCATIGIGVFDTTVMGFWSQLVMLGIGWNFLFIAGTAYLPSTYLPGEQFKAQGFNDATVFSIQALASLSAGIAISATSWANILLVCLLPIALMLALLIWNLGKDPSPAQQIA